MIFPCANAGADGRTGCSGEASIPCPECHIVAYCDELCRVADWDRHKEHCQCWLRMRDWEPDWSVNSRKPRHYGHRKGSAPLAVADRQNIWGFAPAIDILRLPENEGQNYDKPLRVLLACKSIMIVVGPEIDSVTASGDLRNVVKTIKELPAEYRQPLHFTINDKDFDIASRNILLLLLILNVEDEEMALDCMLHIWYSAFVRYEHMLMLWEFQELVDEMCQQIGPYDDFECIARTWKFGDRSLRVALTKENWYNLRKMFYKPRLSFEHAKFARNWKKFTANDMRDDREMILATQNPSHRVCMHRYEIDGVVLPFSDDRSKFCFPNPTFFRDARSLIYHIWKHEDTADPLDGWERLDVLSTDCGPASQDLYGKLYYYLKDMFRGFRQQVLSREMSFEVLNINPQKLRFELEIGTFDRVEV
jgi:hypothetical protein